MRKTFFSANWLTSRFRFFRDFFETINRDLIRDFRTRDFLTIFFHELRFKIVNFAITKKDNLKSSILLLSK